MQLPHKFLTELDLERQQDGRELQRMLRENFEDLEQMLELVGPAPLVTALPSIATIPDGYEVNYLADATNGIVWRLKYRAASPSAYKWEVIGGAPLFAEVATFEGTASTAYTTVATAGPTVTVPLAGDYDVMTGCRAYGSAVGVGCWMSYAIGATAASDNDAHVHEEPVAPARSQVDSRMRRKTGLAAGTALAARYRTSAGTATFGVRWMRVMPVRVG